MAKATTDKKSEMWDVGVVGGGPAGASAALQLAARGHRVILLDRHTFPKKYPSLGWINVRVAKLLSSWNVPVKSLLSQPFTDVTFHNADFSKAAKPVYKEAAGYLVDRSAFVNALVDSAKRAGVTVRSGVRATRVRVRESEVALELDNGEQTACRLLILASGHRGELLEHAGLPRAVGSGVAWSAQVDRPLPKAAQKEEPRVIVVLGLDRRGGFVIFCRSEERLSATVHWFGEEEAALPALQSICRLAWEKKIIPLDVTDGIVDAPLARNSIAAALDMDTHVSKHCVAIGDAGGFIAAASQEGLYPAMWSAEIAANVVDEALRSRHSQDVLKTFDTAWRMQMADYLRSPNTDPQFLVPLVFTNQPMADRMAAAFFSGENI